ncbi:Uncharacterized protein Fot_07255 [Forsythia ovata]|uniref:Uncharacterized protein n=1 Tax=Forsythia ovata TaxID=205694 RepID=A0ABD1WVA7_9LAMI
MPFFQALKPPPLAKNWILTARKLLRIFQTPPSARTILQPNTGSFSLIQPLSFSQVVDKYAEYINQKKIMEMPKKFDTHIARYNMAVQLYKHALEQPDLPSTRRSK